MFKGLCAFPLTPMNESTIHDQSFVPFIHRLVQAGVEQIGVLGSTGNYAYLDRQQRRHILQLAVQEANHIPIMTSISALRTADVLRLADDAQQSGASAVLLAPISYQPLTEDEVFGLYEQVSHSLSVPLCVYDNPRTSHFTFNDDLYARIAELPHVGSIKIPAVSEEQQAARERVQQLQSSLHPKIALGISGDPAAVTGLVAGCDVWYSVLGGLFPEISLEITSLAQQGNVAAAHELSNTLQPLWTLFQQFGSLRIVTALAVIQGWISEPGLPLPLLPVSRGVQTQLRQILQDLHTNELTQSFFSTNNNRRMDSNRTTDYI
ncbi:dihydrodipicolinate synthase family protein [Paenibacillus sp. WLX1005]|uniref:dihydrodipicolinate synthase family protein n=1 Tax=Paenibacillus sp. WLX1005 TaxID=3243766 RepID=UPI0039840CEB